MKLVTIILCVLMGGVFRAEASPTVTADGMISGGGGKVVVCPNTDATYSVELLDLWEAKALFNQKMIIPTGDLASDVDAALMRLKDAYRFDGGGSMDDSGTTYVGQDYILARLRRSAAFFLKPNPNLKKLRGISLTQTDDSYETGKPRNCPIEQLVNYLPNNTIWMDADLFDRMDELNQAALIVHEAFYATLRGLFNETTSIRTRRAVGHAFAGNSFALNQIEIPEKHITCLSNDLPGMTNEVKIYSTGVSQNGFDMMEILPIKLNGTPLIGLEKANGSSIGLGDFNVDRIANGTCDSKVFGTASIGLGFSGAVEFDRTFEMVIKCLNNHFTYNLIAAKPGEGRDTRSELICTLGDAR